MLVPQALMGVAAVALLYATVRRWFAAGRRRCSPGAILALTPVAALMFRFNNPDALLVLLLVAAAYAHHPRAGAGRDALARAGRGAVGFAFLAKMMQAFLVHPGVRARLPLGRADVAAAPALADRRGRAGARRRRRLVGGDGRRCGRRPSRPYIGGSRPTASST